LQIGHLAEVVDTDIAVVLSWHMSADMDCIVTTTTKKVRSRNYNNDVCYDCTKCTLCYQQMGSARFPLFSRFWGGRRW